MTDWISTIIVSLVVCGGLWIFYRALKEPLDLLGSYIKTFFIWGKDKLVGATEYREVVTYQ